MEVFECTGSPREMGRVQGEKFKEKIPEIFDAFFHSPYPPAWLKKYGNASVLRMVFSLLGFGRYPLLSRSLGEGAPALKERFLGIAEGASLSKRLLASLNSIEITSTQLHFVLGCAALGLKPGRLLHTGPLLAYNHDFPDFFENFLLLRKSKPTDRYSSLQITYPILAGCIAGVNEKGLAATLNHAFAVEKGGAGIPPTMLMQETLDRAASTAEAVQFLEKSHAACGSMVTLVDEKGEMAAVELSRTHNRVRFGANGEILTLNRYETSDLRAIEVPESARFNPKKFPPIFHGLGIHDHNLSRAGRFDELLKKETLTLDEIRGFMRDHGEKKSPDGNTICRHHDTARTIASAFIYAAERKMEVTRGNPCKGNYKEYTL
ncbi:MAG: C45 family peptidase [Deltaproteobacteria bacterium]|nr:C45 family peptidase [Deltaproteobacteria bacterium]